MRSTFVRSVYSHVINSYKSTTIRSTLIKSTLTKSTHRTYKECIILNTKSTQVIKLVAINLIKVGQPFPLTSRPGSYVHKPTVLQSKRANFVVFKVFCYIQGSMQEGSILSLWEGTTSTCTALWEVTCCHVT